MPEEEGPPPRLVSNTSTAGAASPASVSGRRAPADPWQTAAAKGLESEAPPLWWTPPLSIYVDPSYKRTASFYASSPPKQAEEAPCDSAYVSCSCKFPAVVSFPSRTHVAQNFDLLPLCFHALWVGVDRPSGMPKRW